MRISSTNNYFAGLAEASFSNVANYDSDDGCAVGNAGSALNNVVTDPDDLAGWTSVEDTVRIKPVALIRGAMGKTPCSLGTGHTMLRFSDDAQTNYVIGGKDGMMRSFSWGAEDITTPAKCVTGFEYEQANGWIMGADRCHDLAAVCYRHGLVQIYSVKNSIWECRKTIERFKNAKDETANGHRINFSKFITDDQGATLLAVQHKGAFTAMDVSGLLQKGTYETVNQADSFESNACTMDLHQLSGSRLALIEAGSVTFRTMDGKQVGEVDLPVSNPTSVQYDLYNTLSKKRLKKTQNYETFGFRFAHHLVEHEGSLVVSTCSGSIVELDVIAGRVVADVRHLSKAIMRDFSGFDNASDNRPARGCLEVAEVMPHVYVVGVDAGGPPVVDMRAGKEVLRFKELKNRITLVQAHENGEQVVMHGANHKISSKDKACGTAYLTSIRMAKIIATSESIEI